MTSACASLVCSAATVEPDCVNLSIVRGTQNRFEVIITDGFGKAVAINNDTIEFIVKDEPNGTAVFTKSNGPTEHSNPSLGETVFDIDEADTATASETETTYWVYEVRRTNPVSDVFVHLTGQLIVRPTI
jgi:hypothetical protein